MKIQKKRIEFFFDEDAMLGLPMRLTVSLVIGTIVLLSVLSFILNPCVFPQRMVVSVTPILLTVPGTYPENVTVTVVVSDIQGHAIHAASVLVKGLGGAGIGFSDETGKAIIHMQVHLQDGFFEGYMDVVVKAHCYAPFEQREMIKVVKLDL